MLYRVAVFYELISWKVEPHIAHIPGITHTIINNNKIIRNVVFGSSSSS